MNLKHLILPAVLTFTLLFNWGVGHVHAQVANVSSAPKSAANSAHALPQRSWTSLTERQQHALRPLQGKWAAMDGARQRKMLALAEQYHQASPEQQARMHERMQAWVIITPEERQRARENFKSVRKVESQARNEKWTRYEQLPVEQRVDLHSQAEQQRATAPGQRAPAAAAINANPHQPPVILRQTLRPPKDDGQHKPRLVASPGMVDRNTLLPLTEQIYPASKP
jgi:hypothetical protein